MEQSPAVPLKKIERERDEARRREPWRREARRVLIACARRSARTRRPRPRRRCGTPPYQDGGFGRPFLDSAGRPTPRPTPINRTCKQGNCISPPEVSNDEICCLLLGRVWGWSIFYQYILELVKTLCPWNDMLEKSAWSGELVIGFHKQASKSHIIQRKCHLSNWARKLCRLATSSALGW
ncbi:hypothetical protein BRADI_3g01515v3 [Brachypodium distachyon]|uniref:Uncharacterized protein n=1 Tax=Brachypodium distachyon TaxID=15368 RepID=A0A2K2CUM4_BRADI|nr:hypothetical protein BRADI_3g01515v3 [Brachypodium distachyon]